MLIFYKNTPTTPAHHLDSETKQKYRRAVGGIGWPKEGLMGVGLVLAEDMNEPANYKVLTAVQDHNAMTLIEKCKALELEYLVKKWHTNPHDTAMILLLYEFNKPKFLEDKLKIQGAPMAGEPNNSGYYLPKVIDMVLVGQERLSAGLAPEVKTAIETIHPDTHLNRDISLFPPLAALCYPLSYMLLYSGRVIKPQKVDYSKKFGEAAWQL